MVSEENQTTPKMELIGGGLVRATRSTGGPGHRQ